MEWISVEERLPDNDGKYLLLMQKKYIVATFYKGYFYKFGIPKIYYSDFIKEKKRHKEVTHWMPLPEMPK